jgi:hypothetical protein
MGALRTPVGDIFSSLHAEVAKLADALDSGSSARKGVRVQIPASAPHIILSPIKEFHRFRASLSHPHNYHLRGWSGLNCQVTVK